MPSKKKIPGYCVYFFAHQGVGRYVEETKDLKKRKKELLKMASNPANDMYHVCCAEDKKEALKKYRDLLEKDKLERKKQRLAKLKEKENESVKGSSTTRSSSKRRSTTARKSHHTRRGTTGRRSARRRRQPTGRRATTK